MTTSNDGGRTVSEVIAFLSANPDFLGEHPELLSSTNQKDPGPAASLTTRQLVELRERNRDLERELAIYRENARANDERFARVREFSLALATTRQIDELSAAIATYLGDAFGLDDVVVFTTTRVEFSNWRQFDPALFESLNITMTNEATLWTLRPEEYERLFGRTVADPCSVAVAPFDTATGALALGSSDAHRFSQQQDTVFLDFTVALIERTIARLAD